jgi:uncharacterized oligopeptide transporter (OPT) family protein
MEPPISDEQEEDEEIVSPGAETLELTMRGVLLGVLLSVALGASNAYLGLKVGMTVSASIPAGECVYCLKHIWRDVRRDTIVLPCSCAVNVDTISVS